MRLLFLLFSVMCAAGLLQAAVVMDFDFDVVGQDTIEALEAAGWVFGGEVTPSDQAEEYIKNYNNENCLTLDVGNVGDPMPSGSVRPHGAFSFGKSVSMASASFRYSNSNSYSNTYIRFLQGQTELFSARLVKDNQIVMVGSSNVTINIADNTNAPLTINLSWSVNSNGTGGSFSYELSDSVAGEVSGTLDFKADGVPDGILYELTTQTAPSRELYLYEIKVLEAVGSATETDGFTEVSEEGETTDSFDIVLSSPPADGSDAKVMMYFDGLSKFSFVPSDANSITFDSTNWDVARSVTVMAIDDDEVEGYQSAKISFAIESTDPNFAGGLILPVTVGIIDNDQGSVLIDAVGILEVNEEGATSTGYTFYLSDQPTGSVTVDLTADTAQISLDRTQVILDSSNWDTGETVTVSAVDDDGSITENDSYSTVISHIASTTDPIYEGSTVEDVTVVILNNDCDGPYNTYDRTGPNGVRDCVTDMYDLATLAADWLSCTRDNGLACN